MSLVRHVFERLLAGAVAVLDHHLEAAAGADAAHRRRRDDEDAAGGDRAERLAAVRAAIFSARLSRSPLSFSGTNIAAALGAVVKVAPSNPAKATVRACPGFFSAIACACRKTSSVRSSEEPGGSWMTPIR